MANKKLILVTGGTSGIGRSTVEGLARTGAEVVFTARDGEKGGTVARELIENTKNTNIFYLECDLASFASIQRCAAEFTKRWDRLDVLINNAGVMPQERRESKDGIELNFAVNFLAPFLLTTLLLSLLKESAPSRIINVSSTMHKEGAIRFDDLESTHSFNKYTAYAQSKLALLLFTKKLAADLKSSGVTVNALHPGMVDTEMTLQNVRKMNPVLGFIYKQSLITPSQGAKTSIYLATSPDVAEMSGKYFVGCREEQAASTAQDMESAESLCAIAEKKYLSAYVL